MELECQVMHYDWGQLGIYSSIAEFVQKNNSRKHKFIEPRKPYAELWVGTHHLAPCYIKGTRQTLFEHIATTIKPGFENVPFIMKILSIESALSIQIHPSKDGVKYLLNQRHDLLSDENHKPELFYTLTDFEMFYGFRPISEIVFFLENIPELFELSGIVKLEKDGPAEVLEQQIKKSFRTLVSSKKEDVIVNYMSLIEESKERTDEQNERLLIPLVQRLATTNPYDTGLFLIYYLNYATLKAGEAMYVAPHDIHSYIKGECIEVQACSDNVIRAGLTKKRRNVNLFCDLVNFAFEKPEGKTMQPVKENDYTYIYRPPVQDFLLIRIEAKAEPGKMIQLNTRNTYSFLLVFKGRGEFIENHLRIQQGSVLYLEKNQDMGDLMVENDLLMFQALENIDEPETVQEEQQQDA